MKLLKELNESAGKKQRLKTLTKKVRTIIGKGKTSSERGYNYMGFTKDRNEVIDQLTKAFGTPKGKPQRWLLDDDTEIAISYANVVNPYVAVPYM